MATIIVWGYQGILLIDYKHKRETYRTILFGILTRLIEAIEEKRRGKLAKGVLILHENVSVHKKRVAMSTMTACGFKELNHPPHSPDLVHSDVLFPNLKKDLGEDILTTKCICKLPSRNI